MNEVVKNDQSQAPAIRDEASSLIQVIARAATDPDVDIDKMERLFAMHERITQRDQEKLYNEAMAAAQAEIPEIIKTGYNTHTKSKYEKLEDVLEAITPAATRYGFAISFGSLPPQQKGFYCVTALVSHQGGFSRDYQVELPADGGGLKGGANKTGIHAFGSTMTYARRYLLKLIFNIATRDDDGNAAGQKQNQPGLKERMEQRAKGPSTDRGFDQNSVQNQVDTASLPQEQKDLLEEIEKAFKGCRFVPDLDAQAAKFKEDVEAGGKALFDAAQKLYYSRKAELEQ